MAIFTPILHPLLGVVFASMVTVGKQLKVLNTVVVLNSVDMVNIFGSEERPTNVRCHNVTMLKDSPSLIGIWMVDAVQHYVSGHVSRHHNMPPPSPVGVVFSGDVLALPLPLTSGTTKSSGLAVRPYFERFLTSITNLSKHIHSLSITKPKVKELL